MYLPRNYTNLNFNNTIAIYRVRRFYSKNNDAATEDISINLVEANKFKIDLQRLTSSMSNSNEDPVN